MITRRGFTGLFAAAAAATSATASTIERKSFFKNGAKMICLSNRSRSQMLGVVFVSPTGQVAVVDGGSPAEARALHDIISRYGGEVASWMITHAHLGHFGALMGLLERPADDRPKIRSLRFSFPSCDWIKEREPKQFGHAERFLQAVVSSGVKTGAAESGEVCNNKAFYGMVKPKVAIWPILCLSL